MRTFVAQRMMGLRNQFKSTCEAMFRVENDQASTEYLRNSPFKLSSRESDFFDCCLHAPFDTTGLLMQLLNTHGISDFDRSMALPGSE